MKTKICVEYGGDWSGLVTRLSAYSEIFVVADRNAAIYAKQIAPDRATMYVDATERNKNIGTVTDICRWLLKQNADRSALLLAIGGGITTDMAGFAASVYKRGIRYANVPTTLLAQADAGIGGKTGVNLDSLKNMIGTITQPEFTYICPLPLTTLSEREMQSGLAEMLKTFIIASAPYYNRTIRSVKAGTFKADAALFAMKAAQIKAGIVRKDEREGGLRQVLNLGHTFAHAIEWYQQKHAVKNPSSHGQAVAIGIVMAAKLSEKEGIAKQGLSDKFIKDWTLCGLPITPPCTESKLLPAMEKDKKAKDGKVHFILIERIGKVTIR